MGRVDAAEELGLLLAALELPYRARWAHLGSAPRRSHSLNRTAVGRVVAAHLVDTDRLDEALEPDWPRAHKDWLNRCLSTTRREGVHPLDWEALTLFCDAFDLAAPHQARLIALWEAPPGSLLLAPPPGGTGRRSASWPGWRPPPKGYHCVRVWEEHVLGPQGWPRLHRSTMTVMADVDGLQDVLYTVDASSVVEEVGSGGTPVGPIRQIEECLWGQVIAFDRPLRLGEQRELSTTTYFNHSRLPPPEFRRSGCVDPGAHIDVRVVFDPSRLPAVLRRCVWTSVDGPALTEHVADMDGKHSSVFTVTRVHPGALVGFRWVWPD